MPPDDEEDDLEIEVNLLDEKTARRLELSVPISSSTSLDEVAEAVAENADVIDGMFDDLMMPSVPPPRPATIPAPPPATIPPPNPVLAAKVFKAPVAEKVITLAPDDEDVILLDEDAEIAADEEDEEDAFYKQFEEENE